MGQEKVFYGQRIPEPICARKETVGIDIHITSRNCGRKIMKIGKWNQLSKYMFQIMVQQTRVSNNNDLKFQLRQSVKQSFR